MQYFVPLLTKQPIQRANDIFVGIHDEQHVGFCASDDR
jgi:hypothetical protein